MAPCVPSPGREGIPGSSCRQEEGGPGDRGAGCKASHARPSPCRKSTRTLPGASQAAGHALEEGADSPLCREPGRPEIRHADGADENQDVKASQEVRPPLPMVGKMKLHEAAPSLLPRMHTGPGRDPDRA